jgi:L-Ala-D/L-Glu epimerase
VHPEKDREILRAVREAAPEAYLWADANQAYEVAAAVALARAIEPLGVGCLEQPVPANDWTGLRQLAARTSIPIGVDESVFAPSDLLQLLRLEACGILVLKLSKMAGIYPAMLGARIAKEAGVGLLGSGLTESRLGLAASAHLIAACGGCPGADLNGPQFLADDPVASGVEIDRGQVILSAAPGIGVQLDPEKLARFRV